MNIEKILDSISVMIGSILPMFFSIFGGDPRVQQIRSRVAESCGFLPTVQSVTAMLAASNPVVTGVVGIATAICQAVTAQRDTTYGLVGGLGTVNGVPIEGEWRK